MSLRTGFGGKEKILVTGVLPTTLLPTFPNDISTVVSVTPTETQPLMKLIDRRCQSFASRIGYRAHEEVDISSVLLGVEAAAVAEEDAHMPGGT